MSVLALLVPALLAVLLDLTLAPSITALGTHPSFCVALVSLWAVLRQREETMVLAPATGLLLGLLGNEPLGASVLALAPAALLGWLRDQNTTEGRFSSVVAVTFLGAVAYVAVRALVDALGAQTLPAPGSTVRGMIGTGVLTTLLAAVLYLPLARIVRHPPARRSQSWPY